MPIGYLNEFYASESCALIEAMRNYEQNPEAFKVLLKKTKIESIYYLDEYGNLSLIHI